MANGMTDYLASKLLDHAFRKVTYTPPATVFVGVFTTATTKAGGGTEVTGGSYARQAVSYAAASGRAVSSAAVVSMGGMPAVTASHYATFDALTGGNMLTFGPLAAPVTLAAGDTLQFAVGQLTETLAVSA